MDSIHQRESVCVLHGCSVLVDIGGAARCNLSLVFNCAWERWCEAGRASSLLVGVNNYAWTKQQDGGLDWKQPELVCFFFKKGLSFPLLIQLAPSFV